MWLLGGGRGEREENFTSTWKPGNPWLDLLRFLQVVSLELKCWKTNFKGSLTGLGKVWNRQFIETQSFLLTVSGEKNLPFASFFFSNECRTKELWNKQLIQCTSVNTKHQFIWSFWLFNHSLGWGPRTITPRVVRTVFVQNIWQFTCVTFIWQPNVHEKKIKGPAPRHTGKQRSAKSFYVLPNKLGVQTSRIS